MTPWTSNKRPATPNVGATTSITGARRTTEVLVSSIGRSYLAYVANLQSVVGVAIVCHRRPRA
jgi:hypothetical protein